MKTVVTALSVLVCFLGPASATAVVVTPGTPVLITQSFVYANYDGGDLVFSTSAAAPGCGSGWYVKATDPGYKGILASVLTAQATGLQVIVYGDNADIWAGSPSGQYCRIQTVGLTS